MTLTRSGRTLGPTDVNVHQRPAPLLPIAYYAPKPAWMTHIPGPWLRFATRHALDAHLTRTA